MNANVRRHHRVLGAAVVLMLALVACNMPSCGQRGLEEPVTPLPPTVDPASLPPTAPRVVAQQPYPGEELPLDGSIDIYFDQPMNRASVEGALSITPALQVSLAWLDDSTLRVTPAAGALTRAARYTLTIGAGAQAASGLALEEAAVVEVQTVGFLQVGEVVPAPGATGVETDSVITVLFNRPVVPLTIAEDMSGLPRPLRFEPDIPGEGEWLNTSIYLWRPSRPLAGGESYRVTVEAGLVDQTGGVMEESYSWEFATLPPDINAVEPLPDSVDVPLDAGVIVTFNQPMDQESVRAAFSLTDSSGRAVSGRFDWDETGRVLTFVPAARLALGETYTANVGAGARNAGGATPLVRSVPWQFTTVQPPAVIQTRPAAGATDAGVWDGLAFVFSAPMDEDTLTEERLVVEPALPDQATFYYSSYDRSWNISAELEPSTAYTVTLLPGAADPYGNTIDEPLTFRFQTGPLPPSVQLTVQGSYGLYDAGRTTELFVLYRNVSQVSFRLASLSLEEFAWLSGPDGWDAIQAFEPTPAQLRRSWTIRSEGALNEGVYARVPVVSETGGSLEPGIYLLIVNAPELQTDIRHFMLVVTSNLTFKISFDEALGWLTDLRSGQPVSGASVRFLDENLNLLGQGTTGRDGVVETSLSRSLPGLWELYYAVYEADGQFGIAMSRWDEGVEAWQFGNIPAQYYPQDYSLYLYTDRPLYRPGQEVYFKGVLRLQDDMTYTLPTQRSVRVVAYNDQGAVIYESTLPVSEMGTFDGTIRLDSEAGLGYYNIEVSQENLYANLGFQVAEYRKPEFIVSAEPEAAQVVAGDTIRVNVAAEFFFGGPVSDAAVTWTVLSDRYFLDYSGPGNYSFTDLVEGADIGEDFVPGFGRVIAEGEGRTDANGRLTITVPARLEDADGSRRFTVEAVVTDINATSVAARTEVIVHQGQVYVGVAPEVYVAQAGDRVSSTVLTVDWDGEPVAGQRVTVELIRQQWNSVREEDEFGRTQWTWSVEETRVGELETVTTSADGRAEVTFRVPEGGTYKVRATVTDARGNRQSGSAYLWVSSREYVAWRQANNYRIELVADRDSYAPGDTAEILIASPFQGRDVRALVTIERGSVLRYEVITLNSNSTVYRLPITGGLAPNVYVSVTIVKGVDDTNTTPAFRVGLVQLVVEPTEQTLNVSVTPDQETAGPREEVTYTVRVTNHRNRPVDAEVSLSLVDLATLSLAPPNSRPIAEHFYGSAALSVRTAVPLIYLVDRLSQELLDEGKGGGGGGGEAFFDIRSNFRDTAYWTAVVRTGRDGTAEVTVTLPDNLTTWRMDARAVTDTTLVGQGQSDLVATRPLLIRPSTPRFFVNDDEAVLSAVVNNNTERAIEATVSLRADGVTVQGNPEQTVTIPASGRVEVTWPVVVDPLAEWVDLVFSVQGGGLQDASKPPLGDPAHDQMIPVMRYEVPETVGTAGQLAQAGERVEGVVLPPTYNVQRGQVDIRIDPSLASATLDGLTWLEHYPYECTEQVVSRFLPNALTLRAFRRFNLQDAELERRLDEQITIGLQRLYAQQHVDGGWGWFVNAPSNPTVSAYVVQGLLAAREAGYAVDPAVLDEALVYLEGQLVALDSLSAQHALHQQAAVLYVLALADRPDASRTSQLYEVRGSMQHYARALLAQTIWRINPADPRLDTLKGDLVSSAILSVSGAHWEEEAPDRWNWNTDTRSTAIILDTFALIWPDSDLAPNIVRWLMTARRGSHWETTQETAWALIGLTDWMTASGELDASYRWTFQFNGATYGHGEASAATLREASLITIDVAQLLRDTVNRLTFARETGPGRLYYTAHLTAYLPVEEIQALSRGVIVSRRYLDASGQPVTSGAVGDIITVELTIIAPNDLYFVVVEDPYPAGAEAVDVGLLTESVLGMRPTLRPDDPLAQGWGWWWFSQTDLRDEKAVMFADYLPAGTYQYTYQLRLGTAGEYRVIPPVAQEFYFPEVYGRGAGSLFTIRRQ